MPKHTRRVGSITPLGNDRWSIRLTVGVDPSGKQVRFTKVIRGTQKDAQRFLRDKLKRKDDGLPVALSNQRLGAWIEEWLSTWCNDVGPRSKADSLNLTRRYLTEDLLSKRLSALTATDLQQWVNALAARGLSPRTVRMAHGTLRRSLNQALRLDKIARNPATLVDLPKLNKREMRAFTPEEAVTFLSAAKADRWYALFVVLLTGGLRPGEALALKWSDLHGDKLRIQRALVRVGKGWSLAPTKTGTNRVVPLPALALDALKDQRRTQLEWRVKQGPKYTDQGFIFATETGSPLECQNVVNRHFKPVLRQIGLGGFRLYDLRHSCATLLFSQGVAAKVVQERLGHSSIALTLDTYTHVLPGMQEAATAGLDTLLAKARA